MKGWKSQKKEKLLLVITEDIRDRKLYVCKTKKCQPNLDKMYNVFQESNNSKVKVQLNES